MNPFKRLLRNIVDVIDPNSEEDQRKRLAQGQPRYYHQQKIQQVQQAVRPNRPRPVDPPQPQFRVTPASFIREIPSATAKVGKGLVSGLTSSYSRAGNAIGETLYSGFKGDEEQRNFEQGQRVIQQTIDNTNRRLRDPNTSPEKRARLQSLKQSSTSDLDKLYNNRRGNLQQVIERTDPVKGTAAILDVGLDAVTAGTLGRAKAGLKTGQLASRPVARQAAQQTAQSTFRRVAEPAVTSGISGGFNAVAQNGRDTNIKDVMLGAGIGTLAGGSLGGASAALTRNMPTPRPLPQPPQPKLRPNEAATLSDLQEVLTGRVRDPRTQSAIIQEARTVQKRTGVDVTTGTPREIQDRINTVLEQPQNSRRLWKPIKLNEVGAVGRDVRPDVEDTAFADMQRGINAQIPSEAPALSRSSTSGDVRQPLSSRTSTPVQPGIAQTTQSQQVSIPTRINRTNQPLLPQNTTQVPVTQIGRNKNVPVSDMQRIGDVIEAKNVNPNVKARQKRFSVADSGELLEDRKGAYRIFTDGNGKVKQVRIGNKTYGPKEFGDLSQVNDYGSTLATMRRNIERGFGRETGEKLNKFLVDHQQAQATKMIDRQVQLRDGMQQIAKDLGINFGTRTGKSKKISAAIQDFGEGNKDYSQLVEEFGEQTAIKIRNADNWFKTQYKSLLDEMNDTLQQFGYDPVPERANYYTHFQDDAVWKKFGLKMQEVKNQLLSPTMQDADPNAVRGKISNALAGESEFTQPNKRFNQFALQRKGDTYTSDAFQAFERYLGPTLNNIYMTPSISRARVVAKAIAQEADTAGKDANKILIQMKEWANDLAGKSNRFDRPIIDTNAGQKYLKAARWLQKKAGQNTIIGNLGSAVVQPIVLTQAAGKFGYKNTMLAALQEMSTSHSVNAAIRQSAFMRRRYADLTPLTSGKMDRTRKVANKPLEVFEETSARITWNSAHNDALSRGFKGNDAIRYADIETEKTLAGRSIGERPELFRSKAAGPLTMYQLEVNNFWQQFGKEMTKAQAVKYMVAAYAFNQLAEKAIGRQIGFNPVDVAIDTYADFISENDDSGLDKLKRAAQRGAGEIVDNAPIIGPATNLAIGESNMKKIFGKESSVGRFGASSPVRTLIDNPWYLASPFGGSQAKKIFQGAKGLIEGQTQSASGKKKFDVAQTPQNVVRGLAFGPNATSEGQQYIKKQTDKLAGKSTSSSDPLNPTADDILKLQFSSKEQKKWLALTEDKKKELAKTDPQAEKWLKQYEATKRVNAPSKDRPEGLSEESTRILDTHDKRTAEQKEKLAYTKNDYDYKLAKARYEEDDKAGKISKSERINRTQSLKKAEIGSKFSKDTREVYNSLSKAEAESLASMDEEGAKLYQQAVAYGDELVKAGILKKNKLKGGSGRGKKRKGGRRGGKQKIFKAGNVSFLPKMATSNTRKLLSSARVEYRGPQAKKPKIRKS